MRGFVPYFSLIGLMPAKKVTVPCILSLLLLLILVVIVLLGVYAFYPLRVTTPFPAPSNEFEFKELENPQIPLSNKRGGPNRHDSMYGLGVEGKCFSDLLPVLFWLEG
jgi:hypothetical protein